MLNIQLFAYLVTVLDTTIMLVTFLLVCLCSRHNKYAVSSSNFPVESPYTRYRYNTPGYRVIYKNRKKERIAITSTLNSQLSTRFLVLS